VNAVMAGPGDMLNQISSSPLVTEKTAEAFSVLDVAGMNYSDARYAMDQELFPNRVIVGSETFVASIAGNWALVRAHAHVIGDFAWTGWDYLGEVGWTWTDSLSSWTWDVAAGSPVVVEVYSDADEVELLLDGEVVGRAPAGAEHDFRCTFETTYRPGELTAVAYRDGTEQGRQTLRSVSGPVRLSAEPDRAEIRADAGDLAFVSLVLADDRGTVHPGADRAVHLEVSGPGVLLALGSARPDNAEGYGGPEHTTFEGRALAVVRPTGPGTIEVTATAEGCDPVRIALEAVTTADAGTPRPEVLV
jgi:hypothetical protein